ncbi:hypothetical protein DRO53_04625 [Candidatus Bathyarchaeota archaeon]|nr:MAG: hypothetical protein DRO53_04625 [Candidatus Bathyarchaeota archaeon]
MKYDVLIAGGGDGGLAVYRTVRSLRPDWEIAVVKPEKGFCFKCPLPFYIAGEAPFEGVFHRDEEMFKDVELIYSRLVGGSAQDGKAVLENGETLAFKKLVLATGSKPYVPEFPGRNLGKIFTLRTVESAQAMVEALKEAERAVIVGGGTIATELCEAFLKRKVKPTLIVRSRLLRASFDSDFSTLIGEALKAEGVDLRLGRQVGKILGEKEVSAVELDDGERIPADLVVFASGTRPVLDPALKLGAALGVKGVKVDRRMETSLKNVYAVGEIAEVPHLVGGHPTTAQTASSAMLQGFVAGFNAAGFHAEYPGEAQALLSKVFSLHLGRAGLTFEEALRLGFQASQQNLEFRDHYTSLPGGNLYRAKMVFDRASGKLLGCQFLGEATVADKVEAACLALRAGFTMETLAFHTAASFPASTFNPRFNQFREAAMRMLLEKLREG